MITSILIYLGQHINYILGGIGIFVVGAINSAPPARPKSLDDMWSWMRDAAQTSLPVNRRSSTPQENYLPPTSSPTKPSSDVLGKYTQGR
jgi:hypothetical protein